jgi:putative Mn2+ efflux pump MntP
MLGLSTVLTTGVGMLVGAIKDIISTAQKNKADERKALLAAAGIRLDDVKAARAMDKPGVQFTRRVIVLAFMSVVVAPVALVIADPTVAFNVPVPSEGGTLSFLFGLIGIGGGSEITYIKMTGFTYVLGIMDLIGLIVGYYFGSNGTQTRV